MTTIVPEAAAAWCGIDELEPGRVPHVREAVAQLVTSPVESVRFRRTQARVGELTRRLADSQALPFDPAHEPAPPELRARIEAYRRRYETGEAVDPIVVYALGRSVAMLDGYLRLTAAREAGLELVDAWAMRPAF